ncbi:hypothetical protein PPACK8108_LOCUS20055 [Phakopsora pachyrhizi]|uniref:Uncharacterized protein n=1 Tax=Phakopsora pachyrhizi TaxID=170000 RepID=A0AAV0BFX9_PHAPC|nr:hypothetical protein PPACK8108_LOCUS20055 [Phakopsora pachyrhizi]
MAPMASLQVSKVKCNISEPTETRGPLVWCNPTIKAYGYEHPIARTSTEDMDSEVSSKGKSRLMVAIGIPSEKIVRVPRISGGLAGSHESEFSARANLMKHQATLYLARKEVEDAQEDLRSEVEPATQKRKECMKEVIDLEDQSQGTRSPSVERIRFLIPILSTHLDTILKLKLNVLEFENEKERAMRLLVNTHRLLGAHVGKMEMDGLLTHAITQLSDWYETLEVKSYEGFEWDNSHSKRKAEDSS